MPTSDNHENNLVSPDSLEDMTLQNNLYVPNYLTKAYQEDFLRDLGMVQAMSFGERFEEKRPLTEVFSTLTEFNPTLLINFLSRLSNYLAWNGPKTLSEDLLQKELYEHAIKEAEEKGYKQKQNYKTDYTKSSFVSPDNISGILAILFEKGDFNKTSGLNINEKSNCGKFGFAILILNDYFQEMQASTKTDTGQMHLEMLRHLFVQAPLWGIFQAFAFRIFRFQTINKGLLGYLDSKKNRYLESLLKRCRGVSFKSLNLLLFPLISICAKQKDFKTLPGFDLSTLNKPALRGELKLYLDSVSLGPIEFQQKLTELKRTLKEKYYKDVSVLAIFTQTPFVKLSEDIFLLLGPHFLLRNIELSLDEAFNLRDKNRFNFQDFYGARGNIFEAYCGNLIKKRFPDYESDVLTCPLRLNPKKENGDEFCDAILEEPGTCVIFEIKGKFPSLAAINPATPETSEIEKWLDRTFLIPPDRAKLTNQTPGALWQLAEAARYRYSQSEKNILSIIPVVIIPVGLIFDVSLYSILDKALIKHKIFDTIPNLCPLLIISVDDLETLSSAKFLGNNWTLGKIFMEKASNQNARLMNWTRFLEALKIEIMIPDEVKQNLETHLNESVDHFNLKN